MIGRLISGSPHKVKNYFNDTYLQNRENIDKTRRIFIPTQFKMSECNSAFLDELDNIHKALNDAFTHTLEFEDSFRKFKQFMSSSPSLERYTKEHDKITDLTGQLRAKFKRVRELIGKAAEIVAGGEFGQIYANRLSVVNKDMEPCYELILQYCGYLDNCEFYDKRINVDRTLWLKSFEFDGDKLIRSIRDAKTNLGNSFDCSQHNRGSCERCTTMKAAI